MYYVLANGNIVVTDGKFKIPKVYGVIKGKDVYLVYEYAREEINGQQFVANDLYEDYAREGDFTENWSENVENYSAFKRRLKGYKKTDTDSVGKRNGRRDSRKDSAVEREVQSGIDDDRRSKRQPNIPKGYTERGYNESLRKKTDLPDVVKDEFIDNPEIYKKLSNKTTQAKADSILQKGTEYAEKEFNRLLANMDAVAIPLGYNLSKEYISAGQQDRGVALLRAMAEKLTQAGQFSQAAVITLTKSNPESALIYLEREIDKLNADGKKTFGKKWKDFKLTDAEKAECKAIKDGDADAIEKLFKKINKRIDKEYPTTIWQKFIEGTRISMLLNPRTNAKNIVSNAFLYPLTSARCKLSAFLKQQELNYYGKILIKNNPLILYQVGYFYFN